MKASQRSLLLGLCFLALLLTDYGVSATTRVHAARRMMIHSAAMNAMHKLHAIMAANEPFRVPGSVDAGVPLAEYPTHAVMNYDMTAPTFGYIHPDDVDAQISANPFFVETRSRKRTGFARDWYQSGKRAVSAVGQKVAQGARWVGDKAVAGYNAVRDAIWKPKKPVCSQYYEVNQSKGDPALLQERNLRRDTLMRLGVPTDGMYHPPGSTNYYKWEYESGKWQCSPTKIAPKGAGWKSLDQCSGDDAFRPTLLSKNTLPIASTDVLEILDCPEEGGGFFKYKAGVLVTPIWFKYDDALNSWQWSPDYEDGKAGKSAGHWMSVDTNVVSGGQYAGRSPVQDNLDIIAAMSAWSKFRFGNLPDNFGENWFVSGVRKLYNSTIGALVAKAREYEQKLSQLIDKIKSVKWSDITNGLSSIMTNIKNFLAQAGAFALRLLGAIIFGLLNGILMGMLDQIGEAWSQCPDIQQKVDNVMNAAKDVWTAIKDLFLNLSLHTILDGCHRVFSRIIDFFKAIWDIVWGCEKLRNTIGLFLIIIVAGLILNAVMVASGYGAVFKVILAAFGLIMAVPFIISKTVALVKSVADIVAGKGADAVIEAVKNYCNILGCIIGIIFLVKEIKSNAGAAKAELANSSIAKKFGWGQPKELPGGAKGDPAALASEKGPEALKKIDQAQKGAAEGKKIDPKEVGIADDAAKAGQKPTTNANQTPKTKTQTANTPAVNERKVQVDTAKYKPGEEAAKILGKPNDVVKPKEWVGMADNPNSSIKGLGAGEKGGQKLFWDPETNCWRNAKGSRDPLTGAPLDGKPVGLDAEGKVAVDLCKINPAFCKSSKQPSSICKIMPFICGEGPKGKTQGDVTELAGLPRNRMPQVTWSKEKGFQPFLDFIKAETGKQATIEKATAAASEMAPTQAEINLSKTIGIAEKLKFAGEKPPPALVIENPNGGFWIVDGHHRWSGVKFAAEMDPKIAATMDVNVIKGITPEKLFSILSKLADNPASRPDVATFAPLLELHARAGQGIKITEAEAKAAWLADVNARFDAAGVQWREPGDADELWEKVMRDRVMSALSA